MQRSQNVVSSLIHGLNSFTEITTQTETEKYRHTDTETDILTDRQTHRYSLVIAEIPECSIVTNPWVGGFHGGYKRIVVFIVLKPQQVTDRERKN